MNATQHQNRQTEAVRSGQEHTLHGEQSEPLFLTSSFRFASAEQAAARFDDSEPGYVYSRFSNPTVTNFEQRLAALEGAEDCLATASGMAAILASIMGLSQAGGRIVASYQLFGATIQLLKNFITKFGVDIQFVPNADPTAWATAAQGQADLFFLETPSNPQLEIYDIAALAEVAHDANATLIVDNCLCTPALQNPLTLGADLVMHSATKYIDGQGRVLGGALCGSQELLRERIYPFLRCGGPSLSPFNAWVLLKGLETLELRVREMTRVATQLAEVAAQHPAVASVRYPFHASHPQQKLAQQQQRGGGGIVTMELKGGQAAVFSAINATKLFSITANFGDAKSTITHPASTTHKRMGPELQERAGITAGLVRLSVGLESEADLHADLLRALDAAS